MFSFGKTHDAGNILRSLDRSLAIIEFTLDGTILTANENFLALMGYTLPEIQGRHHSLFVTEATKASQGYADFWAALRRGDYQQTQFRRVAKSGKDVWIEASYNPVFSEKGIPYKIIKVATDVTARTATSIDLLGKVHAIERSQAVIEFDTNGIVLAANEIFLSLLGYSLQEILGQHHRLFVSPVEHKTPEYRLFWETLRKGEYQAAQYRRIARDGHTVWIQATYNPVFDQDGTLVKIVKFATDISGQVALLDNLKSLIDVNFSEIDTAIGQSTSLASTAAHAASQTLSDVQTVAASAEELAASIREISDSMIRSQSASDTAFGAVESAGQAVERLAGAATAMTGIVGLIQDIAAQINLLALNATIESARAGEAGKGFAVVAGEVKSLAHQAASATKQISQEIGSIQTVSEDVVAALSNIHRSIDAVRDHVATTSAAVEEQSAVTRDMSHTMQTAAEAVDVVTRNISDIGASIHQAGGAFGKTREAAVVLAR